MLLEGGRRRLIDRSISSLWRFLQDYRRLLIEGVVIIVFFHGPSLSHLWGLVLRRIIRLILEVKTMITSWLLHLLCRPPLRRGSYLLIAISRLWLHFVKGYIPLGFLCGGHGIWLLWWAMCPNQILNVRMSNVLSNFSLRLIYRTFGLLLRLKFLDRFCYLLRTISLYQLLNIRMSLLFCTSPLRLLAALIIRLLLLDWAISLNQTMHITVCDVLFHRSLRGWDLPLVRNTALPVHGPLLGHRVLILLSRPLGYFASPKMRFNFLH